MSSYYVLEHAGNPVPEPDLDKWVEFFANREARRVAATELPGDVLVSTIFLGLDHGWGEGPPVLWETLVFGGDLDGTMDRYTSKEAALAGHECMVEAARRAGKGVTG